MFKKLGGLFKRRISAFLRTLPGYRYLPHSKYRANEQTRGGVYRAVLSTIRYLKIS
jgi:hypothetical protein